jgi:hypothetical protein
VRSDYIYPNIRVRVQLFDFLLNLFTVLVYLLVRVTNDRVYAIRLEASGSRGLLLLY